MSRCWQFIRTQFAREFVSHELKYSSVGISGAIINASLTTWFYAGFGMPSLAAVPLAFMVSAQFVFVGHVLVTWKGTRGRKLPATYLLFIVGQLGGIVFNFGTFFVMTVVADAAIYIAYPTAMAVSASLTWCANRYIVFKSEGSSDELLPRIMKKLVEWSNPN